MPFLHDPIEKLTAAAELHDQMDSGGVLVGAADSDYLRVLGEVVHDLNPSPDILEVLPAEELALGDGLAGLGVSGGDFGAEVGGAELALAKDSPQRVEVGEVLGLIG
ncbi:hypothetical protein ACFX13_025200 [Malus domestica]